MIKLILILQIANNNLENAKGLFKHAVKNKVSSLIKDLIILETTYFDKIFNSDSEATEVLYDVYNNYIEVVAGVEIEHMDNIRLIIEAYKKDQYSIEGIVKKILK